VLSCNIDSHQNRLSRTQIKEAKTSTHAYVNMALQLCVAGGGYAIWKNKENMAASKGLVNSLIPSALSLTPHNP